MRKTTFFILGSISILITSVSGYAQNPQLLYQISDTSLSSSVQQIDIVDFNNDGKNEILICAGIDFSTLYIYDYPLGKFPPVTGPTFSGKVTQFLTFDVNRDNFLDLLATTSNGYFYLLYGPFPFSDSSTSIKTDMNFTSLGIIDIEQDGKWEVLLGTKKEYISYDNQQVYQEKSGDLYLLNLGSLNYSKLLSEVGSVQQIKVQDLNQDGVSEIILGTETFVSYSSPDFFRAEAKADLWIYNPDLYSLKSNLIFYHASEDSVDIPQVQFSTLATLVPWPNSSVILLAAAQANNFTRIIFYSFTDDSIIWQLSYHNLSLQKQAVIPLDFNQDDTLEIEVFSKNGSVQLLRSQNGSQVAKSDLGSEIIFVSAGNLTNDIFPEVVLVNSNSLTVYRFNRFPKLEEIGSQTVTQIDSLILKIYALDPDLEYPIFTTSGVPSNSRLTFTGPGEATFKFYPDISQFGTYQVTFLATDGLLSDSEIVSIEVLLNRGLHAPVLDFIGNLIIKEGSELNYDIKARDPDGDRIILKASLDSLDQLPGNADFVDYGNGIGRFSFNPDAGQAGFYRIIFTASDSFFADTERVAIQVVETINKAPTISLIETQEFIEGDSLVFTVEVFDPDNMFVRLYAQNLPENASFLDSYVPGRYGYSKFKFKPNYKQAGQYWINFYSEDGQNVDTQVVEVTVLNNPNMPDEITLLQNYPNPFNQQTNLRYFLPVHSSVTISIYNLLGQNIKVIKEGFKEAGFHSVPWDGKDQEGNEVASGLYFYRLVAESFQDVKKMLFLK